MPTNKPTKPSITLPTAFGTSQSAVKTPFTAQELIDGFSASIAQILDGGNLNFIIDAMFQFLTWSNAYADWFANGSPNTVPYINSSNQLDYESPVFGGSNNTFTGTNTFTQTIQGSISGSASSATTAGSATKATQDGSGNTITTTYAKVDLSNVSANGKKTVDQWGKPSYGSGSTMSSGSTASSNGFLAITFNFTESNPGSASIGGQKVSGATNSYVHDMGNHTITTMAPIAKGQKLTLSNATAIFYPCQGG